MKLPTNVTQTLSSFAQRWARSPSNIRGIPVHFRPRIRSLVLWATYSFKWGLMVWGSWRIIPFKSSSGPGRSRKGSLFWFGDNIIDGGHLKRSIHSARGVQIEVSISMTALMKISGRLLTNFPPVLSYMKCKCFTVLISHAVLFCLSPRPSS